MKRINIFFNRLFVFKNWFLKSSKLAKIIVVVIFLAFAWFTITKLNDSRSQQPRYQTARVQKGTLIIAVTASGQVTAANSSSITTGASGVVSKLYVKDGDTLKAGAKIAEIDLDLEGRQKAAQAFAAYQSASNTLDTAKTNFFSLQSDMLTKWKSYMDIAQDSTYQNPDGSPKTSERQLPKFMSSNDDWLAAEAKYKNQQNVVNQAQTALNSAWFAYQQASAIIYAPIPGTVTGLSLQIGSVIGPQSGSPSSLTSNTSSAQKVASIKTSAKPSVTVNLTEIDIPKVKIGDKATLTFDAFPGKTYTGTVVSVDGVGMVSSGVTTYPTVIQLDGQNSDILANMSASANIITQTKDNVILLPLNAVQVQNGESWVRIMRNGRVEQLPVEIGLSSDSQIEIISGLSEGDTIITNIISSSSQQRGPQTQSPFSGFGGGGFRGGGGPLRLGR